MTIDHAQERLTQNDQKNIWDRLFGAHHSIKDLGKRRQARLISSLLLAFAILSSVRVIIAFISGSFRTDQSVPIFGILVLILFVAYGISRSRFSLLATFVALSALSVFIVGIIQIREDVTTVNALGSGMWLIISVLLAGMLFPWWGSILWALVNITFVLVVTSIMPELAPGSLTTIWSMIIVVTGLLIILNRNRELQEQDRQGELLEVNRELMDLRDDLEERVRRASRELALAADVGQRVSLVRDIDVLLADAVELIKETFDLYYAQIYLPDDSGRNIVLRSGTGDVGRQLLERGHRLPFALTSITGTAATEHRAVIVEDTETSIIHQPNPLLPETRSEMAVPLLVGDRVVGVLDLQSSEPGILSAESLPAFEALAGQLAVSIVNADLFAQVEQSRQQLEAHARIAARQGWDNYLDGIDQPDRIGYVYDSNGTEPLTADTDSDFAPGFLSRSIDIAGEEVGSIRIEGDGRWLPEDIVLVDNIVQQVAQQIDSLRLLEQAEQYRLEAQDALRRLTREGWQQYQEDSQLGFVHKGQQVQPISAVEEGKIEDMVPFEFKVRDEVIGKIGISGADQMVDDDVSLFAEVQEQLSAHIENLRLQQQTEQALDETGRLYQGSERIVRAETIQGVLEAIVESTVLQDMKRVGLVIYDHPWVEDDRPEGMTVMGSWVAPGVDARAPVGTRYKLAEYPLTEVFARRSPSFFEDITSSDLFDENSQAYFVQVLEAKGVVALPLLLGEQSIGGIVAMSGEALEISSDDVRQLVSLVDQAATVIMSQRLYDQAQNRAQQEQALREFSETVRISVDPETILRNATRQIGSILGRKTIVRLDIPDQELDTRQDDVAVSSV